jgi:tRNA modification GTPase
MPHLSLSNIPLRVEELRKAAGRLGEIAGDVQSENVLDALFKEFCIGK